MTLQEVCEKYKVAESSMKNTFPRVQKSILKKYGVKIIKEGRGQKAVYQEEVMNDKRAVSLFMEDKERMFIDDKSFKLLNWDFLVFLAIVTTPMLVFRGSYNDFLKYVEVPVTEANRRMLTDALINLSEGDFIIYKVDKTDPNYFVAALYRKVEQEMEIGIGMVRICKQLAEENRKKSWIPLLKTWLGVQILAKKKQPYTMKTLQAMTGLSEYQIKESNRILVKSSIYLKSRAYKSYMKCIGTLTVLNAFIKENRESAETVK